MKRFALLLPLLVLGLAACGSGGSDALSHHNRTDRTGIIDLAFPQDYSNVAFKCNGTTGVYESGANGDLALLANDPRCSAR